MENLKLHYVEVLNAYKRLEHIIVKLHNARLKVCPDEDDILAYRDSVIKRFEFSYDLTWKLLKAYLETNYSVLVASPKKVFRECFDQNFITEEEARQFLNMADDRNLTTHTYSEDMAEQISIRIVVYYEVMRAVLERLYKA
ncbi:nucleotidyltransferase substrate binding protein [Candidatus Dependentiae bacterium]|nr:nucleotidyltransferase substrate binding protein [Candidatus Dependentiae bacterium]